MEAKSRRRSRRPLSDCTNSIDSLNTSQSSSTSTKHSSSIIKPSKFLPTTTTKPTETQKQSTTGCTPQNDNPPSNPSTVSLSTPPRAGTASHKVSEPCSVYTRRQSADKRKSKGKEVAVPMSCFPAVKTRCTRGEGNEGGVTKLSKSCTVPSKKKRRQTKEDGASHALPQDFIEQQRAYFAEIDAFELPEEEVTSVDDLD